MLSRVDKKCEFFISGPDPHCNPGNVNFQASFLSREISLPGPDEPVGISAMLTDTCPHHNSYFISLTQFDKFKL